MSYLNNQGAEKTEALKAESALILEAIKTGDPHKPAVNLRFLVATNLITHPTADSIRRYLNEQPAGQGPALPSFTDLSRSMGRKPDIVHDAVLKVGHEANVRITKSLLRDGVADHNHDAILLGIDGLSDLDAAERCSLYAKDPQIVADIKDHGGFSDPPMLEAVKRALDCPAGDPNRNSAAPAKGG